MFVVSFIFILISFVVLGNRYFARTDSIPIRENMNEGGGDSKDIWLRNPKIVSIIDSLSFVRHYNEAVYVELVHVVRKILMMYYKHIGGSKKIKIDDFSHEKVKLSNVYEEISMNIPSKYHRRTRKNFLRLNHELNAKMKLLKLQSASKSPLKLSLMNTNLSF